MSAPGQDDEQDAEQTSGGLGPRGRTVLGPGTAAPAGRVMGVDHDFAPGGRHDNPLGPPPRQPSRFFEALDATDPVRDDAVSDYERGVLDAAEALREHAQKPGVETAGVGPAIAAVEALLLDRATSSPDPTGLDLLTASRLAPQHPARSATSANAPSAPEPADASEVSVEGPGVVSVLLKGGDRILSSWTTTPYLARILANKILTRAREAEQ